MEGEVSDDDGFMPLQSPYSGLITCRHIYSWNYGTLSTEKTHPKNSASEASKIYHKLLSKVSRFLHKDTHHAAYLDPEIDILDSFPLENSSDTVSKMKLSDGTEVFNNLVCQLETIDKCFASDRLKQSNIPVKLLFDVAKLYDIDNVDSEYLP